MVSAGESALSIVYYNSNQEPKTSICNRPPTLCASRRDYLLPEGATGLALKSLVSLQTHCKRERLALALPQRQDHLGCLTVYEGGP